MYEIEANRLRMFKNRLLSKMFGPKRNDNMEVEKNAKLKGACFVCLTKFQASVFSDEFWLPQTDMHSCASIRTPAYPLHNCFYCVDIQSSDIQS